MSSNRIKDDTCNLKKNIYQSTQPLNYILNTPQDKHYKNNNKNITNNDNYVRGLNCIKEYDVNKNKLFNNRSNISDDKCYISSDEKQSANIQSYNLSNFHQCHCEAPQVAKVAFSEPSIYYRDGFGHSGLNGCNIDADSIMRNGQLLTNDRNINQLEERPYLSVPYMGRGQGNACVEGQLLTGEDTSQRKPCNTLTGTDTLPFSYTPLVPCVEKNIQNPKNLIPEVVDHDWIRGGIPSRQLKQNARYSRKCNID